MTVVHLFVFYGSQGSEEDSEKLALTDKLLCVVLAEAQVVCVGQPLLIVGDLGVIPCLATGISLVGSLILLWLIRLLRGA